MIEEISELVKSEEDYMSVTFTLAPTEGDNLLQKKMDEIVAEIEEEELKVREELSQEIHKWEARRLWTDSELESLLTTLH